MIMKELVKREDTHNPTKKKKNESDKVKQPRKYNI